jgi:hypothetical protein
MNRMRFVSFPTVPFASQPRRRALPHFMVALVLCALLALAGSTAFAQWPAPRNATGTPAAGAASSANTAQPAAATAQKPAPTAPGAGGIHDGIVVHGQWSIDVKNPDGTLVAHREFENSLASGGSMNLNDIISGANVIGGWNIYLCTWDSAAALCNGGISFLELINPGGAYAAYLCNNLCFPVLSWPSVNPATGVLTITGTATLPSSSAAVSVNGVGSSTVSCYTNPGTTRATLVAPNSAFTPSSCFDTLNTAGANQWSENALTGTSFSPSVTVNPGQSITVTFNLSFS